VIDALIDAAKAGNEAAVRAIVSKTPGVLLQRLPSGESALMAALYRGHHSVVRALVDLGADVDVFAAAATGRMPELAAALQHPGALNAYSFDGWTPLHLASFFGQRDAVRALLDAGAAVNAVSRNSLENTPLHAAAAARHTDVAVLLLERGADPSIRDAGDYTAAAIARENGLAAVIEELDRRSERR
jgi:ankyrin repeat protein